MSWTSKTQVRSVVRAWTTRTLAAAVLTAPLALVGFSIARSQSTQSSRSASASPVASAPSAPVATDNGHNVSLLTKYSMKIGTNGMSVNVYPDNPLRPFDSTSWVAEVPVIVTAVRYDRDRQKLLVSVDYNWRTADEEKLRAQLAAKYREAGKPVAPEAITITPSEAAAHSLLIVDVGKEYLLFSTEKPSKLSAQTVEFRVPMIPGAEGLHERLSTTPEAVQLLLRAGYRFDRIAGVTVDRRALNTAWHKVLETVLPNAVARAESLLVDRNAEQALHTKLATEVTLVIKSYGLTAVEEAETIKTALAQIDKLTVPTSPLSVKELLELSDASLVFTATGGKIEVKPATDEKAITSIKEMRSSSEKVSSTAEAISDVANNTSLDDRRFHSAARKLVLDASLNVGIKLFSASANMHLDKSETELTENHLKEVKQARTYAMNKSAYCRDVQVSYSREIEGMLKTSDSTAKLLTLRRVSVAALAAQGSTGVSLVRITGSEVLFIDTPVALKATPIPAEDDVVLALKKEIDELKKNSEAQEKAKAEATAAVVGSWDIEHTSLVPSGGTPGWNGPDRVTFHKDGTITHNNSVIGHWVNEGSLITVRQSCKDGWKRKDGTTTDVAHLVYTLSPDKKHMTGHHSPGYLLRGTKVE